MTQHEGAEEPRPAVPPPVFRFDGYGVPVDAGRDEPEPQPDVASPYSYDAYGPAADPYVEHVPYDQPYAAYPSTEPVEPAPPPAPAQPPAPREPEPQPEPAPVARFEPIAEPPAVPVPPPEPEPPVPEMPWQPESPAARFDPGPARAPEPEPPVPEMPWQPESPAARFDPEPARAPEPEPQPQPQPMPVGSLPAYAEQPYVHAYVGAEALADAYQGPAPVAWPAGPHTEEPTVVARQAYRPAGRAADRVQDETRERTWALVSHIGGLLTCFLLPLVTFLIYRKRSQFLREHTTEALNFQLMLAIVYVAGAALTVLHFGVVVLAAAWMFAVTCGTLGALAANDGDRFRYPVNLRVIA